MIVGIGTDCASKYGMVDGQVNMPLLFCIPWFMLRNVILFAVVGK